MSRRISATLLLTATLLLLQAVPLSAHGAMVLPPPWQDVDGTYSQERGDGWMGSGVTGYQNDGVLVPDGIPEIIGEEHEGRTWCNAANRDFPGQCSFYARHPWLSPGYAVPYSPCSIFEIEPHTDARTLPGNAQPTRWASGSTVEAEWAIYANHGGGYQYRICPLPASGSRMGLTEGCFQEHVLDFAVPTVDLQNVKSGRTAPRYTVNATRVVEGTWPPGREWATNPIPAFGPDGLSEFPFAPLVPGACGTKGETTTQECPDRVMNWRIIDKLHVPSTLSPGKYVLSMRWDAEGTPQIWAACSDIEITPSVGAPATPSPPTPAPPQAPPRSCGLCSCDACTPTQAYSLWYSDWCGDPYQNGCDGTRPECECSTSASASPPVVATPPPNPPSPSDVGAVVSGLRDCINVCFKEMA